MLGWLSGYWFSQVLYVAAALGLPDRLRRGARTCRALAREAGVREDSLHRLLRALAAVGVFRAAGRGRFALTSLSRLLLADAPRSLRPLALLGGHPLHWRAWGDLLHAVKTGRPAFRRANGAEFFEGLRRAPGLRAAFGAAADSLAALDAAVLEACDFGAARTVVDVGGGRGQLLRRLLARYPAVEGILVDRPEVLRRVRPHPRLRLAPGDFFGPLPPGGDVYLLKFVLHDWDDARAKAVLARCRRAMRAGGVLLIAEVLLRDDARPTPAATHDLNMLVLTGGRERTRAEYADLLAEAGFSLIRVIPTEREVSLLEARPRRRAAVESHPTGAEEGLSPWRRSVPRRRARSPRVSPVGSCG